MADLPIISTVEQARTHDTAGAALVEVPGDMVRSVVWLVETLRNPDSGRIGDTVRSLLAKE